MAQSPTMRWGSNGRSAHSLRNFPGDGVGTAVCLVAYEVYPGDGGNGRLLTVN
ncbi:MAG: hypothetical protein R6X34_15635 [Chloroflexota bacterium]